jgi:hypothetical protein
MTDRGFLRITQCTHYIGTKRRADERAVVHYSWQRDGGQYAENNHDGDQFNQRKTTLFRH